MLGNCFFKLGNKVFEQVIRIPMGLDPAQLFVNLLFYYYENKWTNKNTDIERAAHFGNIFRFIDDQTSQNDSVEFEGNFHGIYPSELKLKKRKC